MLDVAVFEGINAAILKHDLSMDDLNQHWDQKKMIGATSEEVVAFDQKFFANFGTNEDINVIGLDPAESAIAYGLESGLLDEGLVVNLETEPLSSLAKQKLEQVDLVISTGCVGYLTEKSFDRLLPAANQGEQPWFANFVLRMFPFDAIEISLDKGGYVTEKLEGQTFFQRKFASDVEQEQVLEKLRDHGIDPWGKEEDGHFVADFYLSRPIKDAADVPIEQMI